MRHYPPGHPASVCQSSERKLTMACVRSLETGLHRGPDLGNQKHVKSHSENCGVMHPSRTPPTELLLGRDQGNSPSSASRTWPSSLLDVWLACTFKLNTLRDASNHATCQLPHVHSASHENRKSCRPWHRAKRDIFLLDSTVEPNSIVCSCVLINSGHGTAELWKAKLLSFPEFVKGLCATS